MSLGGTLLRAIAQVAANVVVARILGPDQYGPAAVVLGLSVVLELVRSGGFASVVLRSGRQPEAILGALHRLSALVGLVLGAVVASVGGALTWFAPAMPYGLLLLSIAAAFPLAGAVAVPIAVMVQRLEMGRVVAIESTAALIGAGTAIALALAGVGPLAVIAQVVVMWVIVAVGVTALGRVPRGAAASWAAVRAMVGTARDVSLVQVISMVVRTGDRALVAVLFGPATSGFWVQAMQLMTMPLDQIGAAVQRVAVPALAAAGRAELRARVGQFVRAVTLLAWPVLALLGVLAGPVVDLLFGSQWSGSADLLPVLVVAGVAQSLGCVPVWFFVATGRVGLQVRWVLVSQPITVVAIVAGAPWGVRGMAIGYAVACAALVLPSFVVAMRGYGVPLRGVVVAAVPGAVVATVAALTAWAVRDVTPDGVLVAVVLPAVCGVVGGMVSMLAFPVVRTGIGLRSAGITVFARTPATARIGDPQSAEGSPTVGS